MRIATLLVVLMGSTAIADPAADATKLFEEARALQGEGKYPEACAKFTKSFELDRKPGTQLNLGDCAEREGKLRRAWMLFDDAAREYDKIRQAADVKLAKDPSNADAKRDSTVAVAGAKLARDRADAITPKLATVVIRIAEPRMTGLVLRVGDHSTTPAAEVVEHLDAGTITIGANAPGHEPFTTTTKADAGKQVVVDVPVMKASGGGGGNNIVTPPDHPGEPATPSSVGPRQKSRVVVAAGLGGGGLLLVAVSGIVGLSARSAYNTAIKDCTHDAMNKLVCPTVAAKQKVDDAGKRADVATYVAIGGAVLVAGAVVVYFTAPREHLTITPMATPDGGGVSIAGRF